MHVFGHKSAAQKRAEKEKAVQLESLQDAQELIAQLMEQNESLRQQLNDVQEVAAELLEK
jgi:cell shape-determining protein MreC